MEKYAGLEKTKITKSAAALDYRSPDSFPNISVYVRAEKIMSKPSLELKVSFSSGSVTQSLKDVKLDESVDRRDYEEKLAEELLKEIRIEHEKYKQTVEKVLRNLLKSQNFKLVPAK